MKGRQFGWKQYPVTQEAPTYCTIPDSTDGHGTYRNIDRPHDACVNSAKVDYREELGREERVSWDLLAVGDLMLKACLAPF